MKQTDFALRLSSDPNQCQGQKKWYKMMEVNGAYKQDRYEKAWLKSLRMCTHTHTHTHIFQNTLT